MQTTTNYQLKKIELSDSPPDITAINPNWDTVDGEMKANADHRADVGRHFSATERSKLAGIAEGANAYLHPEHHPAAIVQQTSAARFVSDAEKNEWNGKAAGNHDHDGQYVKKNRYVYTETGNVWLDMPLSDYLISCDNTDDITVTVPNSFAVSFPIGTEVEFYRMNTGKVTIAGGVNVTIKSRQDARVIAPQYGYAKLRKIAADTWILYGDLAAT